MIRSKHDNGGKTNGTTGQRQTDYDAYDRFLVELESDPDSVSGIGRTDDERRMIAARLVDASLDCDDPMMAIGYALRAVRLNRSDLDARMLLAIAAQGPRDEFIEELASIVATGEAEFGEKFFRENRGSFWGLIETRPYMRIRSHLAYELYLAGRVGDAIRHHEEMLQLNPNDNLGLRYSLLGHYLETDDLVGARRLFAEYRDESSAMFAWSHVLERYLAGELSGAVQALQHARKQNANVEGFITGRRRLPKTRPEFYSPGDITEAIVCIDEIGAAWTRHRAAVQWLKKEHGSGYLVLTDSDKQKHRSKQ